MTPTSRKRRRLNTANAELAEESSTDVSTLRTIGKVTGCREVCLLFDFLSRFCPSLPWKVDACPPEDLNRLEQSVVCPSESMPQITSLSAVERREPLSDIVDDVICSLLRKQADNKRKRGAEHDWSQHRNLLCHGYVLASDHLQQQNVVRPCPNMRPGTPVLCTQINSTVSFCKSSSFCQNLHRIVGDEMVRILLLNTTMLAPAGTDPNNSRGNYVAICGSTALLHSDRNGSKPFISEAGSSSLLEGHWKQNSRNKCRRTKAKRKRKRKSHIAESTDADTPSTDKQITLDPNGAVPRHSLFHSDFFVPKAGLPSNHVLNEAGDCKALLNSMFSFSTGRKKKRKTWARLRVEGLTLCDEILKRHGKCDYPRLLQRFCPLPACISDRQQKSDEAMEAPSLDQVSSMHTQIDSVHSFVGAVLRRVFPPKFVGSDHNFQQIMRIAKVFLGAKMNEKFPQKALTLGIRVKDVKWLYDCSETSETIVLRDKEKRRRLSRTNHMALTNLVSKMIRWVFCQYLVPLLRSTFYVTEGEFCGGCVLYYRKPVWSMFRSMSMKTLLLKQYVEIGREEALARIKKQRMGCCRLRLKPKKSGVRPLALLSTREFIDGEEKSIGNESRKHLERKRLSTNRILGETFEVLRYEQRCNPQASGAGVFGLNEVYPLLRSFLHQVRSRSSSQNTRLYFTTVDIHRCYDNINQNRLLDIVQRLLNEDDYLIQKYAVVRSSDDQGNGRLRVAKRVGPPDLFRDSHLIAEDAYHKHQKSIFIGDLSCSSIRAENVVEMLREHLLRNMVVTSGRYGERYLLQHNGIPQGSILSGMLCNVYYGKVEETLLKGLFSSPVNRARDFDHPTDQNVHMLVRVVDDFLLVSTSHETSVRFLNTMSAGSPSLGVKINGIKTRVNYKVRNEAAGKTLEPTNIQNAGSLFPWCGMLFDTDTGEVRIDYVRYAEAHPGGGLTIDRDDRMGQKLKWRMKGFVRPRNQPILFDPDINSAEVIVTNFYQALLLCAMKTADYLDTNGVMLNVPFVLRCIDDITKYYQSSIEKRLLQEGSSNTHFGICTATSLWLGRDAFLSIFERRGVGFKVIANELRSVMSSEQRSLNRRWGHTKKVALHQFGLLPQPKSLG